MAGHSHGASNRFWSTAYEKAKLDSNRDRIWRCLPDDFRRGHALRAVMCSGAAKLLRGHIADLQRAMCELPPERRRGLRKKRARPHDLRRADEGHQVRRDGRPPRPGEQQLDVAPRLARLPRGAYATRQEEVIDLRP